MSGFNEHVRVSADGEAQIVDLEGFDPELYWQEKAEQAQRQLNYAQSQLSRLALKGMPMLDPDWS